MRRVFLGEIGVAYIDGIWVIGILRKAALAFIWSVWVGGMEQSSIAEVVVVVEM